MVFPTNYGGFAVDFIDSTNPLKWKVLVWWVMCSIIVTSYGPPSFCPNSWWIDEQRNHSDIFWSSSMHWIVCKPYNHHPTGGVEMCWALLISYTNRPFDACGVVNLVTNTQHVPWPSWSIGWSIEWSSDFCGRQCPPSKKNTGCWRKTQMASVNIRHNCAASTRLGVSRVNTISRLSSWNEAENSWKLNGGCNGKLNQKWCICMATLNHREQNSKWWICRLELREPCIFWVAPKGLIWDISAQPCRTQ